MTRCSLDELPPHVRHAFEVAVQPFEESAYADGKAEAAEEMRPVLLALARRSDVPPPLPACP